MEPITRIGKGTTHGELKKKNCSSSNFFLNVFFTAIDRRFLMFFHRTAGRVRADADQEQLGARGHLLLPQQRGLRALGPSEPRPGLC